MKLERERDFVFNLAGIAAVNANKKNSIYSLDHSEEPYWTDAISLLLEWNKQRKIILTKSGEQKHVLQEGFKDFFLEICSEPVLDDFKSGTRPGIVKAALERHVDLVGIYKEMNRKRGFCKRLVEQGQLTRYRGKLVFTKDGLISAIDSLTEGYQDDTESDSRRVGSYSDAL